MDLTHRFSVPASRDDAWRAFNDLDNLAPCFPGATITSVDGDDFTGSIKIKLGPVALVYAGRGTYVERDERHARLVIEAEGQDKRGNGAATARVSVSFVANGDQTDIEVHNDLSITGKPAQFGRGVISDVSDKLLDQFVSCVSARFADGLGGPAVASPSAAAAPQPTVELGEGPGAVDEAVASEHPVPDPPRATAAESRPSPPGPRPDEGPYTYRAPSNLAQPHFHVVATVVPLVLKRYWPALGGAALAFVILNKVLKRH